MMSSSVRDEAEIFEALEKLCKQEGYIHVLAYLLFRENIIMYEEGNLQSEDIESLYSEERIVRNEFSTLIGLMCKQDEISYEGLSPDVFQTYIDQTDSLLKELHYSTLKGEPGNDVSEYFNGQGKGQFLREAIFYGPESAYIFQYLNLYEYKYKYDKEWFVENKKYSTSDARMIIESLEKVLINKLEKNIEIMKKAHPDTWTFLSTFEFGCEEVVQYTGIDENRVKEFVDSLSVSFDDCKSYFKSMCDYNPVNAFPFIKMSEDKFFMFQSYALAEAFYETPFYWFCGDKEYKKTAEANRGKFTEEFSFERLIHVFGEDNVFLNVDVIKGKENLGEVDVLVVYSNRVIILQAKSKKLTISARKGNDKALEKDFEKAVQGAYDQSYECSEFFTDENVDFICNGIKLNLNRKAKEIYPLCVVSDHYPALTFQARDFLSYRETDVIKLPFVMDIFLLDVLTEMLDSPLFFLSYINRRTSCLDQVVVTHEIVALAYHLTNNLYLSNEYDRFYLHDDISIDLDVAMMSRRTGAPGNKTPPGILEKYRSGNFGNLIRQIESFENSNNIDLGFLLLTVGGDTVDLINKGLSKIFAQYRKDKKHHDFAFQLNNGPGITVHSSNDPFVVSAERLEVLCKLRKYAQKSDLWFGIFINAETKTLVFGVKLDFKWVFDETMEEAVKSSPTFKSNVNQVFKDPFGDENLSGNKKASPKATKKKKNKSQREARRKNRKT